MGSLVLDVLRKGIWSSFCGGWYYDPNSATFTNTFHLYLFIFFLCFPFSVYVYLPRNALNWFVYTSVVGCVFLTIKLVNLGLHRMFDTSECVVEESSPTAIQADCDKRKSVQKLESREEEGIELQVLNRDRKSDSQQGDSALSYGSVDFADFNVICVKEDSVPAKSGTIDLKVDVHRKNSSDSSEGASLRNDHMIVIDEINSQNSSKEKISNEQRVPDVTSSEEILIGKDSSTKRNRKRKIGVMEMTSQDVSAAVDSVEKNGNRLLERSRQYSVSVTLGEGSENTNTINDPTPAKSMQLNSEYEADAQKNPGLLYWKEKWDKSGSRGYRQRANDMCPSDFGGSSSGPRRSSSPLSIYGCDVRPIAEHTEDQQISKMKPCLSDDDADDDDDNDGDADDDDDYPHHNRGDDEDTYGDIEDLDVELVNSHSPLLAEKRITPSDKDESVFVPPSHRKRSGYVDSLTRKYKLVAKNNKDSDNNDVRRSQSELNEQKTNNPDSKTEQETLVDDSHNVPPFEDAYQISAMFDWLFSQSGSDHDSSVDLANDCKNQSQLSNEDGSEKMENIETKIKVLDELKTMFPDIFRETKTRLRFASVPTLSTGNPERLQNVSRQRSGTCSQLEIGLALPNSENEPSSLEAAARQSTSTDVFASTEDTKAEPNCSRPTESNEASSSGSNTELSSLLPISYTTPVNSVNFYQGHRMARRYDGRNSRNRNRRQSRRCRTSNVREAFPAVSCVRGVVNRESPTEFSNFVKDFCRAQVGNVDSTSSTHIATSYDDTTEGAVHIFQDENGQWMSYTFDERGSGVAVNLGPSVSRRKEASLNPIEEHHKAITSTNFRIDNCTTYVNSNLRQNALESNSSAGPISNVGQSTSEQPTHSQLYQIRENDNGTYSFGTVENPTILSIPYNHFGSSVHPNMRFTPLGRIHGPASSQSELNNEYSLPRATLDYMLDHITVMDEQKQRRRYYKFRIFPFSHLKVYFDRLSLDALLDFNETYFETFFCIFLAILVSLLGAVMLHHNYYHDIAAFIFCFVIATSHYSLLKSVQPDAASPVHGFNKVVAYSRPVYFISCCSLIIGLNGLLNSYEKWMTFQLHDVDCDTRHVLATIRDFLCGFILFFPVFFTLGMFPQVNTFLMYVFEQVDMHIFGGSAVTSLKAASYCIFRSLLAILLLFGFAYGSLNESKSSQHLVFSIFISLLVIFAYHLSRSTCDPTPIWNILVKQFWSIDDDLSRKSKNVQKSRREKRVRKNKKPKKKISVTYLKDPKIEQNPQVKVNIVPQESDEQQPPGNKKKNILEDENDDLDDPLPACLQKTVNARLQSDLITSCTAGILIFSIHRSTVFSVLQPDFKMIMWWVAIAVGFMLHYIMPQLRKQLPWLCIARPVLRSLEHEQFEAQAPATVTWFEKVYIYLGFVEKNIVYPVLFIGCLTEQAPMLAERLGPFSSSLILTVCGLKCLRLTFSHTSSQYLILAFTVLFFHWKDPQDTFVIDYFLISIFYYKIYDLLLKVQFVLTYIAPWQITWGSAFHAFAQPFSLPHSAMMFAQATLSAFLSSPLYPFLGSAIFLTSYPRPIKFWERDYNTRRVDHSNTKMASHLERNLGADDNNLNSLFYEHLTRSLQRSLCGDLLMGRWGEVSAGDCYILASDYLNCLIHIVELGNGLVTFQMRGLEFRGTYCQQREVEAIRDGVEENDGCCCCKPGHLPFMLSLNAAFSQRWLAWEVTTGKYILEGYSISDNSAASMLQVFDFRKMLISYYVKSIIYYAVTSPKLDDWINSPLIREALQPIKDKNFVDLDPVFNMNIDEDYDYRYSGITRNSFCSIYANWIRFCNTRREKPVLDVGKDSPLVTLCFALSLLGRRTLGTASHNTAASVEFFLYGVHTLFKGDFRIASGRDEWVFTDMELLRKVVAPAIRMSLKLHQDHFMAPDEYECSPALFAAISSHQENLVISHEGDPIWRKAVLSGMPSLLALRRVMDEGSDDYKIIMLNKRFLSFRVIKMNRECVRGLWAGQQQELIYLRNLNPERGSIQNAKQALRNIINSSCDQPIGYPIFVSPLTTSYAESNFQYTYHLGGSVSIKSIKNFVFNFCRRVRKRCVEGCSSGSSAHSQDDGFGHDGVYSTTAFSIPSNLGSGTVGSHQSVETSLAGTGGTMTRVSGGNISTRTTPSSAGPSKPGLVTLAGLLSPPGNPITESVKLPERRATEKEEEEKEPVLHRVKVIDPAQVHDGINQGRLIDVIWPDEVMRQRGGRNFWKDWVPEVGMEGQVVHRWIPNHPNPNKRSTFDRTILLVKIDDKYVPISENGVQDLGAEV